MSRHTGLYAWIVTVSTHLPALRGPQAKALALWSFGTAVVGPCGRTTVAAFLALWLQEKERAVDPRLREWYCAADAKAGSQRQTLDVRSCFPALLRWVLSHWPSDHRRLAFAVDATTLGQRFTVLALCLLYRGTAIPIAWTVLPATAPGAWKKHWQRLLRSMVGCVPADWTVLVLADRGLYAPWLFRAIRRLGWHPYLRLTTGGYYRAVGQRTWKKLAEVVVAPGRHWAGVVYCHKTRSLRGTLLAWHAADYTEPWLILTDLAPEQAEVGWYALRTWIECSFKTAKRGAWQWQRTRMEEPDRASRLWLVLALATLWTVSQSSAAQAHMSVSHVDQLPARHIARRRATGRRTPRLLNSVHRGRLLLLAWLLQGKTAPVGSFAPETWPGIPITAPPELET